MTQSLSIATLLLALGVAAAAGHAAAAQFVLVEDGQPRAQIVATDDQAGGPARFAREELQRYLKLMSGADVPWVEKPTGAAVMLEVDPKAIGGSAPDDPVSLDRYTIDVGETEIRIRGASDRALLYGVYDLLERLGCGWCVPGDDTVPTRRTIGIEPVRIDTAPVFRYRMMLDFPMNSVGQTIAIADWLAKNRMNWIHPCENAHGEPKVWYERRETVVPQIEKRGLDLIFGGHTMHTWCPAEHFEQHPDWFALIEGERKAPTLCVTHAGAVDTVIAGMRRFLDRCPEVDVIDLWHPDGQAFCHCHVCTRGVLGEQAKGVVPAGLPHDSVHAAYVVSFLVFINQVAEALAESHPGVMVSPLIYGSSDRAIPDAAPPLHDNALYGLAHIFRDSYRPLAGEPKSAINSRFLGNDITWMAKASHHYIYEYYNGWSAPYVYPGAQVIVRDLKLLREVGCQGSSSDMYGYSPINMYVAARALWSPDIDWRQAVRDFCRRFYGNVADRMADNRISLEEGIYGKAGFQANGGLEDHWEWLNPECGQYLREQRPRQIAFLESMLREIDAPAVEARLERDLLPWKAWSAEKRWWAFPRFGGGDNETVEAEFEAPPGME